MKINDIVKLNKTIYAGIDFYSPSNTDFKEGSIGRVCEIINDKKVFVEFDNEIYEESVIGVDIDMLTIAQL